MPNVIGRRRRLQVDPSRDEALPEHLKVLVAMAEASAWSTKRIPYEEIVLQAWRRFPGSFSLRGHPEHPDASDVHKRIYQTLKPNGLAVTLGNKYFRLTEAGLERAKAVEQSATAGKRTPDAKAERLDRAERDFVERAMASPAFEAWRAGRAEDLIDYDAKSFFEFTTGTDVAMRAERVKNGLQALERASRLGVVGAEEALELGKTLMARFARLWGEEEADGNSVA